MKTLNVAIIGYGFMGRAHSNAYGQVGHFFSPPYRVRRKVVCGRNRAGAEELGRVWGWEEVAQDWQEVVGRRDIDLVDVCTPNALHAPIAQAAAAAGKMVLCEKPLAASLAEARAMAQAVAKAGVPNMVWFNYRRVPAIAFAHELIERGTLGRLFHYRATYLQEWGTDPTRPPGWKLSRAQAGSGANGDLNSHLIDTALLLAGPITEVSAMMTTFVPERVSPAGAVHVDVDDAVLALVRFASGALGSLEATRFAVGCKNRNGFELHGEKGMLRFNLEDLNHLEYADATGDPALRGPRSILVTGPGHPYVNHYWKPGHVIGYEHTFISALADFLESLDRPEPFHPNFDDGLGVQQVLEAVEV
ncbi:MAG: Gfo/Idh/MocA family oxidoreductase, partial [Acidobacteria bacterium]|nr:Gfo/Idh/MocA family oxidoreductase [Acidobacteriota bacterium]